MGECLDGAGLGINGALLLGIYWIIGIALLIIGNRINSNEYGIIKTVTYAMGVFFFIAGVFALLNVYEKSAGIGDIIKNISVVFVQSTPYALMVLLLIALLYKIFDYMQETYDRKGVP
jgi:Ca2+/H+ antiporter